MKKQELTILLIVWGMLGATALGLSNLQKHQRLGTPGLKVVAGEVTNPEGKVLGTNLVYLPEELPSFTSKQLPVSNLEYNWLPRDTVYGRRFYQASDGFEVVTSVVLMGADRTSIHKPQYCLTGQGWAIEKEEVSEIEMTEPVPYTLKVIKMTTSREGKDAQGRESVWKGIYVYWFVADDQLTPYHGQRMWWIARDLLTSGVLQRWAYVTYFSTCPPGGEEATYERMKKFIALSAPKFQLTTGKSDRASALEPLSSAQYAKED